MPDIEANTANTVSLIDDAGTTYYFHDGTGTRVKYTGANTPWTAASTSCYALALNETAGPIWVPQPAPGQVVYGGGPPFVNGRLPIYKSYDNVTEPIGVQLYATDKDGAIFLLKQLRKILNTALFSRPCLLLIKGGTNTDYFEIYSADVSESSLYLVEPQGTWRATITWTRQPFGAPNALTTLLNAVTFTNIGTGANNNFQSLGALTGDMPSDQGNPMHIKLATPNSASAFVGYAAIAKDRFYMASGLTITTSSTTGVDVDNMSAVSVYTDDTEGTTHRFIARVASPSANLQLRAVMKYNNNQIAYTGPWITPGTPAGAYLDLGYFKVPRNLLRMRYARVWLTIQARSTNGSPVSGTLTYMEVVAYYTWLRTTTTFPTTTHRLHLVGAALSTDANGPGAAYGRVIEPPIAYLGDSGDLLEAIAEKRGGFPRAFTGAGLYLAWTLAGAHSTTATLVVTAQHLPLYRTVRGGA